jgi:hypothetical protein
MMDTIIGNPEIEQKELKPALSPIVEGRAARKAERMRKLCMSLPEDRYTLGARVWRRLLLLCGSRWALAWIDEVEDFYLALSWEVIWLIMKAAARRAKLPH